MLKKVAMVILYQWYKLYYLSVACKRYNPNWICDLVKHLESYFGLAFDSDFLHPKVQIVNV